MKRPVLSQKKAQEWCDSHPRWTDFHIKIGKTGYHNFSVIDGYGQKHGNLGAPGCGYDKLGTCIGHLMTEEMADLLPLLANKVRGNLTGLSVWNQKTKKKQDTYTGAHCEVRFDGGCGISSVQIAINLIGLDFTYHSLGQYLISCHLKPLTHYRDFIFGRDHW